MAMPVIPALRRGRKENQFKDSPGYLMRPCLKEKEGRSQGRSEGGGRRKGEGKKEIDF
jgi:hypothetical protein